MKRKDIPRYWTEARDLWYKGLQRRRRADLKVANNTYLRPVVVGGVTTYVLRLHSTDVVTWYPDETIDLNHGGWPTVTTRDRMNRAMPQSQVWADRGKWYLHRHGGYGDLWEFERGRLRVEADGRVNRAPDRNLNDERRAREHRLWLRKLGGLARAAVDGARRDELPACWQCHVFAMTSAPPSAVECAEHVNQHVQRNEAAAEWLQWARAVGIRGPAARAVRELLVATSDCGCGAVSGGPDEAHDL